MAHCGDNRIILRTAANQSVQMARDELAALSSPRLWRGRLLGLEATLEKYDVELWACSAQCGCCGRARELAETCQVRRCRGRALGYGARFAQFLVMNCKSATPHHTVCPSQWIPMAGNGTSLQGSIRICSSHPHSLAVMSAL